MKTLIIAVTIVFLTITLAYAESEPGQADTQTEMEARKQAFMEKYDSNQDGVLSKEERQSAREAMQADRGPRRAPAFDRREGTPPHPRMSPERRKQMMQQWDVNGDGELSPEEREAARDVMQQRALKYLDANGNGVIDPEEREAARAAAQQRRKENSGAGRMTPGQRKTRMLERFDTNGDGALDETERAAAREAVRERRAEKGKNK